MRNPRSVAAWLLLLLLLGGCTFWPKPALEYRNDTLEAAVQSWTDAYNRDRADQLRLLVHPEKRADFNPQDKALRAELATLLIQRYEIGHVLNVNESIEGREVTFWLHDGSRSASRKAVWVLVKGHWWRWRS